jgi:hypothetical protein
VEKRPFTAVLVQILFCSFSTVVKGVSSFCRIILPAENAGGPALKNS